MALQSVMFNSMDPLNKVAGCRGKRSGLRRLNSRAKMRPGWNKRVFGLGAGPTSVHVRFIRIPLCNLNKRMCANNACDTAGCCLLFGHTG